LLIYRHKNTTGTLPLPFGSRGKTHIVFLSDPFSFFTVQKMHADFHSRRTALLRNTAFVQKEPEFLLKCCFLCALLFERPDRCVKLKALTDVSKALMVRKISQVLFKIK
jgi:hypothetical protein